MMKRVISLVVLVPFMTVSLSCYYTSRRRVDDPSLWVGSRPTIVGVVTKTGETYLYSPDQPARLVGENVVGVEVNRPRIPIDMEKVAETRRVYGKIKQIKTTEGQIYEVKKREGDTLFCISYEERSVPLSEVDYLSIRKGSAAGAIIAAAVIVGAVLILVQSGEEKEERPPPSNNGNSSCPFIYSFDGTHYVFDAEPFGGAICRALQRTDWCCLDHLAEMNGTCTLMVTNELQETQYTDELGLLVVDHPQDVSVIPDRWGHIHTMQEVSPPVSAFDETGRDIGQLLSENDWLFWTGTHNAARVAEQPIPRHELLLEFEKPLAATQAKVVVNACNSVWASASLAHFLELHGSELGAWYDDMNERGTTFYRTVAMHLREELFSLQLRVETDTGWETRDLILGGGPFASDDKVYCIDVSDIPGERLRVKLTPPPHYWMINYVGVDYGDNLPVAVMELEPSTANNRDGLEVTSLLTDSDDRYHVMEPFDPAVNVVFDVPPRTPDMDRSFVLKATGYYDIHVSPQGEPNEQLLQRIAAEPGFAPRYAAQRIEKWHEAALQRLALR